MSEDLKDELMHWLDRPQSTWTDSESYRQDDSMTRDCDTASQRQSGAARCSGCYSLTRAKVLVLR